MYILGNARDDLIAVYIYIFDNELRKKPYIPTRTDLNLFFFFFFIRAHHDLWKTTCVRHLGLKIPKKLNFLFMQQKMQRESSISNKVVPLNKLYYAL